MPYTLNTTTNTIEFTATATSPSGLEALDGVTKTTVAGRDIYTLSKQLTVAGTLTINPETDQVIFLDSVPMPNVKVLSGTLNLGVEKNILGIEYRTKGVALRGENTSGSNTLATDSLLQVTSGASLNWLGAEIETAMNITFDVGSIIHGRDPKISTILLLGAGNTRQLILFSSVDITGMQNYKIQVVHNAVPTNFTQNALFSTAANTAGDDVTGEIVLHNYESNTGCIDIGTYGNKIFKLINPKNGTDLRFKPAILGNILQQWPVAATGTGWGVRAGRDTNMIGEPNRQAWNEEYWSRNKIQNATLTYTSKVNLSGIKVYQIQAYGNRIDSLRKIEAWNEEANAWVELYSNFSGENIGGTKVLSANVHANEITTITFNEVPLFATNKIKIYTGYSTGAYDKIDSVQLIGYPENNPSINNTAGDKSLIEVIRRVKFEYIDVNGEPIRGVKTECTDTDNTSRSNWSSNGTINYTDDRSYSITDADSGDSTAYLDILTGVVVFDALTKRMDYRGIYGDTTDKFTFTASKTGYLTDLFTKSLIGDNTLTVITVLKTPAADLVEVIALANSVHQKINPINITSNGHVRASLAEIEL